jgi:hypothetical protein
MIDLCLHTVHGRLESWGIAYCMEFWDEYFMDYGYGHCINSGIGIGKGVIYHGEDLYERLHGLKQCALSANHNDIRCRAYTEL